MLTQIQSEKLVEYYLAYKAKLAEDESKASDPLIFRKRFQYGVGFTDQDFYLEAAFDAKEIEILFGYMFDKFPSSPLPNGFDRVEPLENRRLRYALSDLESHLRRQNTSSIPQLVTSLLVHRPYNFPGERPFAASTVLDLGYDLPFALGISAPCIGASYILGLIVGYKDKITGDVKALAGVSSYNNINETEKYYLQTRYIEDRAKTALGIRTQAISEILFGGN
jgi:hypothetical protein